MNHSYLDEKVRLTKLVNPDAKLPVTESEIMEYFEILAFDLAPENINSAGDNSMSALVQKRRQISDSWKYLESKLGRKVSTSDVESYFLQKRK